MHYYLFNKDMENERYSEPLEDGYDDYVSFSVELAGNNYSDDTFTGSLFECCEYIKEHYTQEEAEEERIQIAEISITPDGAADYTYGVVTDLEVFYYE